MYTQCESDGIRRIDTLRPQFEVSGERQTMSNFTVMSFLGLCVAAIFLSVWVKRVDARKAHSANADHEAQRFRNLGC